MARGQGAKKSANVPKNGAWTVFVDCPLPEGAFPEIQATFPSPESVFDTIQDLVVHSYRVSVAYNPTNDACVASLTCRDDDSPNAGKTLTAYADDWYTALQVVLFKHIVVLDMLWGGKEGAPPRPRFG